jgi:hypothetical protein
MAHKLQQLLHGYIRPYVPFFLRIDVFSCILRGALVNIAMLLDGTNHVSSLFPASRAGPAAVMFRRDSEQDQSWKNGLKSQPRA